MKAVAFDLVDVLFPSPTDPVALVAKALPGSSHGLDYVRLYRQLQGPLDLSYGDREHFELLVGNKLGGNAAKFDEFFRLAGAVIEAFEPDPTVRQIFEDLAAAGVPLYLLSNFPALPFDRLFERHPFLGLARGCVVSGKLGIAKPDPRIYLHLLETYELDPMRTLFIDDLRPNVDGAHAVGMPAIHFRGASALRVELEALGLSLPASRR